MLDFEKAFGDFVEGEEYDRMENGEYERLKEVVFAMLRTAYRAGWVAMGGTLAESRADGIEAGATGME